MDLDACVDDSCCLLSCRDTFGWTYSPPPPTPPPPPPPPLPNSLSAPSTCAMAERPTSVSPLWKYAAFLGKALRYLTLIWIFYLSALTLFLREKKLTSTTRKMNILLQLQSISFMWSSAPPRKRYAQPQRPARRRRQGFLSDRNYRHHLHTQTDVANCWRCYLPTAWQRAQAHHQNRRRRSCCNADHGLSPPKLPAGIQL